MKTVWIYELEQRKRDGSWIGVDGDDNEFGEAGLNRLLHKVKSILLKRRKVECKIVSRMVKGKTLA